MSTTAAKKEILTNALGPAPGITDDGFVNVREAAAFLAISRAKLYQLLDAGDIRFAKIGRARRIPRKELRAYAERCIVTR